MSIRIRNTRTGRTTEARNGKDAALMVKIEQDRRDGAAIAKQAIAESMPVMEQARLGCGPVSGPPPDYARAS